MGWGGELEELEREPVRLGEDAAERACMVGGKEEKRHMTKTDSRVKVEVLPGFEPGFRESKSRVITTTL